jgi:HSP20 family protein
MAIKDLVPKVGHGREHLPVRHGEYEPFRDFQRQMNRLFDDFFGDFPIAARPGEMGIASAGFTPRVDVSETDKEIRVSAELPGMDEKDVTVELNDDAVTIRGERKEEKEEKGKNWYAREQTYGVFHRTVPLPSTADTPKAGAKFRKGVLTITIPKRAEAQTRRKTIKIETE